MNENHLQWERYICKKEDSCPRVEHYVQRLNEFYEVWMRRTFLLNESEIVLSKARAATTALEISVSSKVCIGCKRHLLSGSSYTHLCVIADPFFKEVVLAFQANAFHKGKRIRCIPDFRVAQLYK